MTNDNNNNKKQQKQQKQQKQLQQQKQEQLSWVVTQLNLIYLKREQNGHYTKEG